LGPVTFPAPGFVAEQHFFYEVEVAPEQRQEPSLDGSPLEQFGQVATLSVDAALAMCRRGEIQDSKTELGLRRLKERHP
jgi:ADP-ribose pyrophosphatase